MNVFKHRFGLNDKQALEIVEWMFFETGTTEGIADHIALSHEIPEVDRYAMISSEYGAVLKAATSKDYLADLLGFLAKLYYGEGGKVLLSSRGKKTDERVRYIPSGLYVCAFLGIQDLDMYFDQFAIKQGFARRFIMIHCDVTDKSRRLPPIDPTYRIAEVEFSRLITKYEDMFNNYNEISPSGGRVPILVVIPPEVRGVINDVWKTCEDEFIQNPDSLWLLYKQIFWEHLYKLTVLEAISRVEDPPFDLSGSKILEVKPEDVKNAGEFMNASMESIREIFSRIEASPKPASLMNYGGTLMFIYNTIDSAGQNGISKSELLRKTKLLSGELKRLLITLMESDLIVCYRTKGGKGRRELRFYSKRFEPTSNQNLEHISVDVFKLL
jgi:hypothetical protein